jgi:probable phosphoglycerate mutase
LSSPANRAQETARIIADTLGVPMRIEPALRPLGVGDGLDWDERFAEWEAGRDPSPPGGESLAEVGQRVDALVESLPGEVPGRGAAVLVAHSEVIGAYLGQLLDIPPHRRLEDSVANGSISAVDQVPGGPPRLLARNLRPGEAAPAGR